MKDNQLLSRVQKFLQRLGVMRIWGILAAFQILILLILLITWPPVPPVNLTLVVPASEATYWSSLINDFETNNRGIQISLIEVKNRQGDLTEKLKEFYTQPPETFQQLLKISQVLQKQGAAKWGYVWQGREYEGLSAMFVEVLQGYGGFWINPTTQEVGLDKPEAIAAVRFLARTIEDKISPPEVVSYSEDEALAEFQQGNAVFLRGWPFMWTNANAKDSPIRGKVGIQPMRLHDKDDSGGGCNGSWGLGIAKASKHPDEAWKAIAYLTSVQAQRQFILETGYIPSRKTLFSDRKIINQYRHFQQLSNALKQPVLRPPVPEYAQASEILQRYLNQALRKQRTPEQAMKAAAAETRKLLGNN